MEATECEMAYPW